MPALRELLAKLHQLITLQNRLSSPTTILICSLLTSGIFTAIVISAREDNQLVNSAEKNLVYSSPDSTQQKNQAENNVLGSSQKEHQLTINKKQQISSSAKVNKQPVVSTVTKANKNHLNAAALGIGLSGIGDWSTQLPFLDAFKSSRQWFTQCVSGDPGCDPGSEWDTEESEQLDLDKDGWVKSLPDAAGSPRYTQVSTLLLREIPGRYPSGKYIVAYEGEGTIDYGFDAAKDEAASTPGRDIINVNADRGEGIYITIKSTDPRKTGNYIRNIRVIRAEDEAAYSQGAIFNSSFINRIKGFKALRFMDWMGTNGSEQKSWSNRPSPKTASYASKGVPVEVMVALANQINAEPWFNMPHQANDEYMAKFAQVVKQQLNPKLKVYVEFSNEVWNWQFPQSQYALQQGQARWGKDKGDAYMQWYGMRSAQMCDIWKSVFAEQQDRVVCAISTQTAWQGLENAVLDCPEWVAEGNKPCYQHGIDAYAITGYFGGSLGTPEHSNTVEAWLNEPDGGLSKALQQLKQGKLLKDSEDSLVDVYQSFQYHASVAKKRSLNLVAYEGGQHIVGHGGVENNENLEKFFIALNRHPAMYDLYTQLLNDWKQAGGGLFMHFVDIGSPSKWGSWGALESVDQKSSPKYKALVDFKQKHHK